MAKGKGRKLTPDQERFVAEYLVDRNGTQAYRRAFPGAAYTTARSEAARLLAKPSIRAELDAARAAQERRTRVTADRVVREAARVAFSDPLDLFDADGRLRRMRDVPPAARAAIAAVKVKRVLERTPAKVTPAEVVEVKLWDKGAGLDKLCRVLGLYKDPQPLDALLAALDPALAAVVRAALAAAVDRPGPGAGGAGAGGPAGDAVGEPGPGPAAGGPDARDGGGGAGAGPVAGGPDPV